MPVTINGTTGVVSPDGSASTPSYQGSDSNTGMFFPAADTIAFATAGTEDMRIDSVGNVGIGTSSPGYRLDVNSGSNFIAGRYVSTSTATIVPFADSATTGVGPYIGSTGNALTFGRAGVAEYARIDSSGNLLVGTTSIIGSNGCVLEKTVDGGRLYVRRSNADNVAEWYFNGTRVGSVSITSSATSYNTGSDYRLKENIAPMIGALAKVSALKPCTFKWKSDGSEGQGFIAHELQEVCPDAVTGEKDAVDADGNPQYQGIDTSFLVATLTAAIQELTARVQALEAK